MFRKFISLFTAASVLFTATATMAGGVIPQGMGMANDGRTVNIVPASSNRMNWKSYGSLTALDRDTIQYAIALVDYETQEFSFFWFDALTDIEPTDVQVFYSGKGGEVSPECLDSTPGGCVYGVTNCLTKTKQGAFELCSVIRVDLYMANIAYGAQVRGISQQQMLRAIVRHETGHVLGLSHRNFGPGPMTTNDDNQPFNACNHEMWRLFDLNPEIPTWIYPPLPEVCQ